MDEDLVLTYLREEWTQVTAKICRLKHNICFHHVVDTGELLSLFIVQNNLSRRIKRLESHE